jgi:hypothetical protein
MAAAAVLLPLALAAPLGGAQARAQGKVTAFDATRLHVPADLNSTWLIHAGDDPAFANPQFDDAQWTPFDPQGSIIKLFPQGRPEVIWYRLRVQVDPAEKGLALREYEISRAFELYVNGERLLAEGTVAPYAPNTLAARDLTPIPERMVASGSLLIALRAHISQAEWVNGQDPGYYASNLTIGQAATLDRDDWLAVIGENSLNWLEHLFSMGLGLVALVLFSAQRRNTEYLWIAALGLLTLAESPEPVIAVFYNFPVYWEVLSDLLRVATPFLLASMYFSFAGQRIGWRWRIFLLLTGILNAFTGLQGVLFTSPLQLQLVSNLPFLVLLSVIIPIVMAIHWRRSNREAGILLIPAVLFSLYVYAEVGFGTLFQFASTRDLGLRALNMIDRFPAGPFVLSLNVISGMLSSVALAVIILLRSSSLSRRQAMLESELAAAQQVQQVLLPEKIEAVPGFTIESIYQPAEQVGGDFFQVMPAGDGGLLVVVGDVAGKGLPAAMLVSVLVGSIRTAAEDSHAPDLLLRRLNERLIGRTQGSFSTALAAYISSSGRVTISNAGHLSPYLDGKEIELPGALPLGVHSLTEYETTQFYLACGSRLTFYSDGVVEAQNRSGELFGFERGRVISTQPAAAIVDAARSFGQQDDITVVTIERAAAIATAA